MADNHTLSTFNSGALSLHRPSCTQEKGIPFKKGDASFGQGPEGQTKYYQLRWMWRSKTGTPYLPRLLQFRNTTVEGSEQKWYLRFSIIDFGVLGVDFCYYYHSRVIIIWFRRISCEYISVSPFHNPMLLSIRSFLCRSAYPSLSRAASSSILPQGLARILEKRPDDVVVTFAKRTAVGRATKGQLKDTPVDELMYALFKATFERIDLDPSKIDDICVGTCHPPSPLYVSRAAAIAAHIPHQVPISTVNRLCSSGLMAIRHIAQAIKAGEASLGIAIGVESMSKNPRPTPQVIPEISQNKYADDCMQPMGWTSEMVAQNYQVSRKKQDEYAYISHTRAAKAQSMGIFAEEIIPIELKGAIISVDDTIRQGVKLEGLSALKPVFPDWGDASTTAGNASGLGDGAGICILASRAKAEEEGMEIIGKYVASTVVGVEPRYMGIAPIYAIPRVLFQLGLTKDDVDVFEINEAFASQFAYCVEELEIPINRINPNGGSIAISHPLGMTGLRQVVTGLAELKRQNKAVLCTSMCIGSGMGAAGIFVNEMTH